MNASVLAIVSQSHSYFIKSGKYINNWLTEIHDNFSLTAISQPLRNVSRCCSLSLVCLLPFLPCVATYKTSAVILTCFRPVMDRRSVVVWGILEEFTAPMINRWAVKQFHRGFTGLSPVISPLLLVNLKRNFTGETVKHFHRFFTVSPVKNSPP